MSNNQKDIPITRWVSAKRVMQALECSQTIAYEHLRRAAQRPPGVRGLLRVPVDVWEQHARATFLGTATDQEPRLGVPGATEMESYSKSPTHSDVRPDEASKMLMELRAMPRPRLPQPKIRRRLP